MLNVHVAFAARAPPFNRIPNDVPATSAAPRLSVTVLPAPQGIAGVIVVLFITMPPLATGKVSVTDIPVSGAAFGLVIVSVSVTGLPGPPTVPVGLKAFVIVGGASAVKDAVAPAPAVGVCSVVTPLTLLIIVPADAAVTVTSTKIVQLPLAGILMPLNVTTPTAVLPALGIAPVQVPRPAPI